RSCPRVEALNKGDIDAFARTYTADTIQIDAFGRTTRDQRRIHSGPAEEGPRAEHRRHSCAARRRDRLGARHLYFEIRGSQHDAWGGQLGSDVRAGWRWLEHRCARILAIGARFPDEVG